MSADGEIAAGAPETPAPTSTPAPTPTPKVPFSDFASGLNAKYQEKIKRYAQMPNYFIHIATADGNGGYKRDKVMFTRMKLLQFMFDEIEDLRSEANELQVQGKPKQSQDVLKTMYSKAASYLLWNAKEERPMTEQEYRMADLDEVRPALDSAMLISLVTDPN